MHEINKPAQATYFLAFSNDELICHYGKVSPNQCLTVNQPNIETFFVKQDWINRAVDFGYTIDYDQEVDLNPVMP